LVFFSFNRIYGARRCSKCLASISSSELVMRARHLVYHVQCFSCAICNQLLNKGDQFGIRSSSVYCRWVSDWDFIACCAIELSNKNIHLMICHFLKVTLWRLSRPISTESVSLLLYALKSILWFTKCTIESEWFIKSRWRFLWCTRSASKCIGTKFRIHIRTAATAASKRPTAQTKTQRYRGNDSQFRWVCVCVWQSSCRELILSLSLFKTCQLFSSRFLYKALLLLFLYT
jgi:hypothetical protein